MGGKIYGTKKSKERREEPLGTMPYQTSYKRSPPFWLLIGARKTQVFWHQSEARTAATVCDWSGKALSPGALLAVLYFSSCHIFFRPFRLFLVPTICPWVSEDANNVTLKKRTVCILRPVPAFGWAPVIRFSGYLEIQNPDAKSFTWSQKSPPVFCRLDYC